MAESLGHVLGYTVQYSGLVVLLLVSRAVEAAVAPGRHVNAPGIVCSRTAVVSVFPCRSVPGGRVTRSAMVGGCREVETRGSQLAVRFCTDPGRVVL